MAEHDGKFIRYMDAIKEINPLAQCTIINNNLDAIEWTNGTSPISVEDIETKATEIETRDAHIFQRERDYPSIADQLDDIYHNGVDGWKATIKATKDKYPKP